MRRRDFTMGLLLASAVGTVRAEEGAKQHRIALISPTLPAALLSEKGPSRGYQAFFEELRRLGDVEGKNLTVDRYSGQGGPAGYPDLAREVVSRKPDVIVVSSDEIARTARAADDAIPILVWTAGDPVRAGLVKNLAHPGGNITGVMVNAGNEIYGKSLQLLKEAVPTASKVAFLDMATYGGSVQQSLREPSRELKMSVVGMPLRESTATEIRRVFAELAQDRPDAIMVHGRAEFTAHHQLIVELANERRLPAMYAWRDYVEAGGLMAYGGDLAEVGRYMADALHQILKGAAPGDIPMYQPTKFELVINLRTAAALGLTLPPALLALADEVIE
jgi:putative tryptophan/tyrosine transport system substrate-binding protein